MLVTIEQKYRNLSLNYTPEDFYIQHNEPLYIKLLKLKMLKKIMKQKFDIRILNEVFNYVKSPDIEFSIDATKIFFDCASCNPTILTFKHVVNIVF